MSTPKSLAERLQRKTPRLLKTVRQRGRSLLAGRPVTRPVFVLGSQRSGTRLPLVVMNRSPRIMTFSEGNSRFFNRVLLHDDAVVARELSNSPFPFVVLKPICESHRAVDLLDRFPGSKAIWIYRNYRDAVNSAAAKWTRGREHLRNVAVGNLHEASWRAGGLSGQRLEQIRELYSDAMSQHAAHAVIWYFRNQLLFDLSLDRRRDVLLVKYEDLVLEPARYFPRLFQFIECPFRESYLSGVYNSSVASKPFPAIPAEVERLCSELMEKLDGHYQAAISVGVAEVRLHCDPRPVHAHRVGTAGIPAQQHAVGS